MCTKWFSDGDVHKYFNPYDTPYDAFINYMNILSDFTIRVNSYITQNSVDQIDPSEVSTIISSLEARIKELKKIQKKTLPKQTTSKTSKVNKTAKKTTSSKEKPVKEISSKKVLNTKKEVKKPVKVSVKKKSKS